MSIFKILYIQPDEFYGLSSFLISFIRISNYLKAHKSELNKEYEEKFVDLRYEDLPKYYPENLEQYRQQLKGFFRKRFKSYDFNLVAISCYTSFNYLNGVEIAFFIKKFINPQCKIVVGGFHPSVRPNDFSCKSFPQYFYDFYPRDLNPFDFLIKDEGEINFFELIKELMINKKLGKIHPSDDCIVKEAKPVYNLNDLPPIDLTLIENYRNKINFLNNFYIDFTRGCPFRCKTCPSKKSIRSYKLVRFKSIDKCLEEIEIIQNTFSIENLVIVDPIFFPDSKKRKEFYRGLNRKFANKGNLKLKLHINDRIEICSKKDLRNYKKFNITPNFGFENASRTLLYRIGKKNIYDKKKNFQALDKYFKKFEKLIKFSNNLEINPIFFYLIGAPGEDTNTIKESYKYFFTPRKSNQSIVERYSFNLLIAKYIAYIGSPIFDISEELYGTKIYFKEWWKIFDKNQLFYGGLVDPSATFSFIDSINKNHDLIIQIYKHQLKKEKKNSYYFSKVFNNTGMREKLVKFYTDLEVQGII